MTATAKHAPSVAIPPYQDIKHKRLLPGGLVSCSQTGFNIAKGPLVNLRDRLRAKLANLEPAAEPWDVPTFLRHDWVPRGVWHHPPEQQWCAVEPQGHLLTPRPLMHLLNNLRHHPVDQGRFMLKGQCSRLEVQTLPLLRQITFEMVEPAMVGGDPEVRGWLDKMQNRLWQLACDLDLPVEMHTGDNAAMVPVNIRLVLPGSETVSLAGGWLASPELLAAYGMEDKAVAAVGCGLERWCLGIIARYGVDARDWPL